MINNSILINFNEVTIAITKKTLNNFYYIISVYSIFFHKIKSTHDPISITIRTNRNISSNAKPTQIENEGSRRKTDVSTYEALPGWSRATRAFCLKGGTIPPPNEGCFVSGYRWCPYQPRCLPSSERYLYVNHVCVLVLPPLLLVVTLYWRSPLSRSIKASLHLSGLGGRVDEGFRKADVDQCRCWFFCGRVVFHFVCSVCRVTLSWLVSVFIVSIYFRLLSEWGVKRNLFNGKI